jgi:hypothetical protein
MGEARSVPMNEVLTQALRTTKMNELTGPVFGKRHEEWCRILEGVFATAVRRVRMIDSAFFRAALRRPATTAPIQRGTRFIQQELMCALVLDQGRKITRNDAFDFFHAVVPVAYCDFVLLDGYWETQVERLQSRFQASASPVPMARVFSRRRGGIEQFIRQLEQA